MVVSWGGGGGGGGGPHSTIFSVVAIYRALGLQLRGVASNQIAPWSNHIVPSKGLPLFVNSFICSKQMPHSAIL